MGYLPETRRNPFAIALQDQTLETTRIFLCLTSKNKGKVADNRKRQVQNHQDVESWTTGIQDEKAVELPSSHGALDVGTAGTKAMRLDLQVLKVELHEN